MSIPSDASYEARITRLERSLRRTQLASLGLLVLLIALSLVWYGVGGIPQRLIVAKRISVIDDSGAMRIRIGEDKKTTGRASRAAGIVLYDVAGHERGAMATMSNGRAVFGLDAPNVPDGQPSDRLGLIVDGKGHALFALADNQGMPVVMMKSSDKGGALQVMAPSDDQKQIQVRTLGVKGDTQSTMGGE